MGIDLINLFSYKLLKVRRISSAMPNSNDSYCIILTIIDKLKMFFYN